MIAPLLIGAGALYVVTRPAARRSRNPSRDRRVRGSIAPPTYAAPPRAAVPPQAAATGGTGSATDSVTGQEVLGNIGAAAGSTAGAGAGAAACTAFIATAPLAAYCAIGGGVVGGAVGKWGGEKVAQGANAVYDWLTDW